MSKFQFIVIAFFSVCIIVGVILFATYKGKSQEVVFTPITVWGTMPADVFNSFLQSMNTELAQPISVSYTEIPQASFDKTFIESLARGQGPDAVLLPQDSLYRHRDKVITIPYTALTQRDFQNTFVEQAELYLDTNGILAIPFTLDPLVMYWNRDIFTNAGIATFPKYWDELIQAGVKINQKDVNSNIRRSAVSLGEFVNLAHAREILGTLLLQAGNPVTEKKYEGTNPFMLVSALDDTSPTLKEAEQAITFFTKFSNPRNPEYSWNRSLPNSKSAFLSGLLATYIGYASEFPDIREKNPNIDYDIAALPQARGAKNRVSYGLMYGFSIVRSTADANNTFNILSQLTSPNALSRFSKTSYLPPVRRDMISTGTTDPYLSIFYDSALISKGWLDGNNATTYSVFKNMIESITSGRKSSSEALRDAGDELGMSLRNI